MDGEEQKIIKNIEVFEEFFIPSRILHREDQLNGMRNDLKPLLSGKTPRNIFLYGPPGTGKTCLARYITEELSKEIPVFISYVNCWKEKTGFKILYQILKDFSSGFLHSKGISTDELLEFLERKVKEREGIIILDEIDKLTDERILYEILSFQKISLILISNKPHALTWFDPRIRSRLASIDNIEFPLYKTSELVDILWDRVEWGLFPGVIKRYQLEVIANASEGDARKGIQILKVAATEAENLDLDKITDEIVKKSIPKIPKIQKDKLESLNPYQRLILKILEQNESVDAGTLFYKLQSLSKAQGLDPIVDRTFRKYMERLVSLELVESKGEGRWRRYRKITE